MIGLVWFGLVRCGWVEKLTVTEEAPTHILREDPTDSTDSTDSSPGTGKGMKSMPHIAKVDTAYVYRKIDS